MVLLSLRAELALRAGRSVRTGGACRAPSAGSTCRAPRPRRHGAAPTAEPA